MDSTSEAARATGRRHYIDNLRWMTLMLLIPYHTAMAWNTWDEPNYIFFESSKVISSLIVFFSPFFMPLLFVLAGVSTRFSLRKRTYGQYLAERAKRLLIPLVSGTVIIMPIMTFIADVYNYSYSGGFFEHYAVFFTKFTDLTGADGGFSLGQFWFLLYSFVISAVCAPVLLFLKKNGSKKKRTLPFPLFLAAGLPLPLLSEMLSVGGKSLVEYTWLFLLGYFLFSDDEIINKAEKHCLPVLVCGTFASALNVYLFLWSDSGLTVLNTAAKFTAEWLMTIGLIGFAKKRLDSAGRISSHMSRISFMYYSFHFVWVTVSGYLLHCAFGKDTPLLFFGTVLLSAAATLFCCDIGIRVPLICFLTGTKAE